mgnify:CR=1 FL=1
MKKYLIFAASALALASCSSDDFLGENPGTAQNATTAINFGGEAGKITRANLSLEDAVKALNKNFVVYGYKTKEGTTTTVYDHYNIAWKGTDNKTETNTKGWEYVGVNKNSLSTVTEQTIKYWDYSAEQYDFVAFSFGSNTQGTGEDEVEATKVTTTSTPSYSLTGKTANLEKCFIADRITAMKEVTRKDYKLCAYGDNVTFAFRSLATKVKMGIYEIIPGYSVKEVKFYQKADDAAPVETPTLYAATTSIPADDAKGTMKVTFGSNTSTDVDFNEAKVNWAVAEGSNNSSTIAFETLSKQTKEKDEKTTGTVFIGRDVTTASMPTDFKTVLPVSVGDLTLKVDYTLESIDGSGEEIKVKGATAVIPAIYTNWQPNFAYTYIFKISDKTNGNTGDPTKPGLYPIVFDAVVTETSEGIQNTITTDEDPSITTYAKGALSAEYDKDANIYVSVKDKGLTLDPTANCALYTVTATDMNITEASVANCLVNGTKDETNKTWTITDGTKNLVVTAATGLSIVNEIDATDTPDGKVINGNFAKFKAATAGTYYAFEYTKATKKYYKVIKIKDVIPAP